MAKSICKSIYWQFTSKEWASIYLVVHTFSLLSNIVIRTYVNSTWRASTVHKVCHSVIGRCAWKNAEHNIKIRIIIRKLPRFWCPFLRKNDHEIRLRSCRIYRRPQAVPCWSLRSSSYDWPWALAASLPFHSFIVLCVAGKWAYLFQLIIRGPCNRNIEL